ncbi:MAG: class I SAM-dependent methyltransferase [Candidatus Kariarchaeaceae archaeon]
MKFHFDILAPVYNLLIKQRYPAQVIENCPLKLTDKLLEVGGGTGRYASHFIDLVNQVWIVDPSQPMLDQTLKEYQGKIQIKNGTAENLPFPNEFFDIILASDSLHHWEDQEIGITEIYRVLRPGGYVAIEEIHPHTNGGMLLTLMEKALFMGSKFFTPNQLTKLLLKYKFRYITRGPIRSSTYYLIVKK